MFEEFVVFSIGHCRLPNYHHTVGMTALL